ncbi:MAG: FixH family protein [Nitrospirota bacterium]
MKRLILCAIIFLLIGSIAYAKGMEINKKTGGYDVRVYLEKDPPVIGDNQITVTIKDAAGKVVTDAKVRVDYSMPAMPGMPPMNYKTDAAVQGNEYRATMKLSMSGPWNIAVKITRGSKRATVKFNIDVR